MGLFGFGKKKKEEVKPVAAPVAEKTVAAPTPIVKEDGEKIVARIFCAAGASTSLWAQNVQKAMDAQGRNMEIRAFSISVIDEEAGAADIVLIGPQTRYVENDVKAKFPDKTVAVVPMQTFGLMNGDQGLKFIDTLIK
ncbi:MAG: hypothetical protein LBV67_03855 [Streptococcaceae bacterium]|nr:hypothetical protein [Streptococcaceae bacterium]